MCAHRKDPVAAALTGERAALQRLLATARPFVTRYCRARIGHDGRCDGTADGLAREVCRAVLGALPDYREQDGSFLTFVYRIAAVMIDAHQATRGPAPTTDPNGALPPEQREILVLRALVGLSAVETAAILGCTDARVRLLQHRALNTVRASLQPDGWHSSGKRSQTGQLHDQDLGDQERGCDDAQFRSRPRYG